MTIDPATLSLRIDEAFGNMPYPGDEHIVIDNSGFHLECEKIKSALKGHHWRDISFETLEQLRGALPFLARRATVFIFLRSWSSQLLISSELRSFRTR